MTKKKKVNKKINQIENYVEYLRKHVVILGKDIRKMYKTVNKIDKNRFKK